MLKHATAKECLEMANTTLLDIRRSFEREFKIERAKHIPLSELSERYHELSPETSICVFCKDGLLSFEAALALEYYCKMDVYYTTGGINDWKHATTNK